MVLMRLFTVLLDSLKRMGRRGVVGSLLVGFFLNPSLQYLKKTAIPAWNFIRTLYFTVITINEMSRTETKQR